MNTKKLIRFGLLLVFFAYIVNPLKFTQEKTTSSQWAYIINE
jgi:hypothetical protein